MRGEIETPGGRQAAGSRESSGGRFVIAFLLFGTTVAIALLLLLTALVVWLSELTGSFIASALILGGFVRRLRGSTPDSSAHGSYPRLTLPNTPLLCIYRASG